MATKYNLNGKTYTRQDDGTFSEEKEGVIGGFVKGVAKGALSTLQGASTIGQKILNATAGKVIGQQPEVKIPEEYRTPSTGAQKAGFVTEQVAEFFIPASKIAKTSELISSYKATGLLSKLVPLVGEKTAQGIVNVAKLGGKVALRAGEAGGITALQTGEFGKESKIAAGVGGAIPVVGAGLSAIKRMVPSILGFTSGVPTKAIEKAAISPTAAKLGRTVETVESIQKKSTDILGSLRNDLSKSFSTGLEDISKTVPRQGVARTVSGTFSRVKNQFKSVIETGIDNVANTLRKFRVAVIDKGNTLDFDKLQSSIISSSERKQIQMIWDTIKNQTDFSPKGVQDVAARINALSKYEKGAQTVTSAVGSQIHNVYDKAIGKVYPELGALRKAYGETKNVLDSIGNIVGEGAKSPVQIQSAVNRLTNIFKTDRETYIELVKELSNRSGVDVLGLLAGTEFQKVLPDFVRGLGGGGAVSVGAAFLNPFLLLLAPLFSPRFVGKIIEKTPTISKVVSGAARATEAIPSLTKD